MSKYNNGKYRISVAGDKVLQNKPISIVNVESGEDAFESIEKEIGEKSDAESTPSIISVTDITKLTATQLNALRCGDIVVKKTGNQRHCYHVAYKDDTAHECSLVYCDAWNVEEVYYDKSVGSKWSHIETKITPISTPDSQLS